MGGFLRSSDALFVEDRAHTTLTPERHIDHAHRSLQLELGWE